MNDGRGHGGRESVPWKRLLSVALSIGLLLALATVIDLRAATSVLSRTNLWWYCAAWSLFLLSYFPTTARWSRLIRTAGYDLDYLTVFRIVAIAYGLNKVLPMNAGDLGRTKLTERYHPVDSHTELLSLVAAERLSDLVVVVAGVGVSSLFFSQNLPVLPTIQPLAKWAGLLVICATVLVGLLHGDRIWALLPSAVTEVIATGSRTLRRLSLRSLALLTVYTLLRWLFVVLGFLCILASLDRPVGLVVGVGYVSMLTLVSLLPLTPAGLGTSETAGVALLMLFGFSQSASVAATVLQRSLGVFGMALIGAIVYAVETVCAPSRRPHTERGDEGE